MMIQELLVLKVGKDTTWSNNMIKALARVKTKYVFLLLDDYIINAPVNEERFIEMLSLLEQRNAAYIEIVKDDGIFELGLEKHKKPVEGIDGVIYRSKNSAGRNSLQASIWDTDELKNLLDPKESVWDFEVIGSKRTENNPKSFFAVIDNPAITYLNAVFKRVYEKEVVDYINLQGIDFQPTKMPIKTKKEMSEYKKSKEAAKLLSPYGGNKKSEEN